MEIRYWTWGKSEKKIKKKIGERCRQRKRECLFQGTELSQAVMQYNAVLHSVLNAMQ